MIQHIPGKLVLPPQNVLSDPLSQDMTIYINQVSRSSQIFRKMDQGPQGLLFGPLGPTDGAEELEKAHKGGYFSSLS